MPSLVAESAPAETDSVPVHRLALDAAERLAPWWPTAPRPSAARRGARTRRRRGPWPPPGRTSVRVLAHEHDPVALAQRREVVRVEHAGVGARGRRLLHGRGARSARRDDHRPRGLAGWPARRCRRCGRSPGGRDRRGGRDRVLAVGRGRRGGGGVRGGRRRRGAALLGRDGRRGGRRWLVGALATGCGSPLSSTSESTSAATSSASTAPTMVTGTATAAWGRSASRPRPAVQAPLLIGGERRPAMGARALLGRRRRSGDVGHAGRSGGRGLASGGWRGGGTVGGASGAGSSGRRCRCGRGRARRPAPAPRRPCRARLGRTAPAAPLSASASRARRPSRPPPRARASAPRSAATRRRSRLRGAASRATSARFAPQREQKCASLACSSPQWAHVPPMPGSRITVSPRGRAEGVLEPVQLGVEGGQALQLLLEHLAAVMLAAACLVDDAAEVAQGELACAAQEARAAAEPAAPGGNAAALGVLGRDARGQALPVLAGGRSFGGGPRAGSGSAVVGSVLVPRRRPGV